MAIVPEFISVLRKIRDVIYPSINKTYEDSLILKASIDAGKEEFDEDFAQFNIDYIEFEEQKDIVISAVASANASALSASQSATIATNKSNEIKGITAQSITGAPGTNASASYNPNDGKFTFTIPQGIKGDKGESFTVNSSGVTASRALYDNQPTGWSFLDVTTSLLYFKQSNATADWSNGVPFGKGDKGDQGEQGVGIQSFAFLSTTDSSGLAGQAGATDTYRVTLTNTNTFDYVVYNGLDADDSLVLHKALDEDVTGTKTFADNKLKVKALDNKVSTIRLENGATSNIDLIIPKEGGKVAIVDSPAFIGTPTAPTQSQQDNSTKVATTAYVDNKFVRGAVVTASGTAVDFIGIPSWAKRITVLFEGLSTNGTSPLIVKIGTSTGFESTGYISSYDLFANAVSVSTTSVGFGVADPLSSSTLQGSLSICNIIGNDWISQSLSSTNVAGTGLSAGSKSLSGVLDRVRITTINGTDTFDAGSINIMYEG